MKLRLPALLLLASMAAFAGDDGFDRLVRSVERQFGVKKTYIPFMGVANFFVKVARPAGTSGIKVAVFEDLKLRDDVDPAWLDRTMAGATEGLRPMVRVHSRRDHEVTYIYAGDLGKTTKMLIATFERDEATIVEVKVNLETLMRTVNEHSADGEFYGRHDRMAKNRGMKEP